MIPQAPISTLRVALRAANAFTLDLLRIHRGERDFTDAIILATLVQSSSAAVEMRRAISVNAIATSLGLPFETVRRRTKRLIADGLCEASPHGVRLSAEMLRSPEHARALEAGYAAAQGLYGRLAQADCIRLMDLPPLARSTLGEPAAVGIVGRAAADYFLRMVEMLLPGFASITCVFVVLEVARANIEHIPDAVRGGESFAVEGILPDEHRKPVRPSDVATCLGIPHETVRRALATLVAEDRCLRVGGGFIVPAAVLARPRVIMAMGANFSNMGRMFGELADAGVLALWDAERAASGSAA